MIFWGPSGFGKTQFALAHFKNPLFVTHLDELSRFNKAVHDGIVFDDMSFSHLPRNTQIYLLDQDNNRAIHVRYKTAKLPKHTKKIFTTNTREIFSWVDDSGMDDKALLRRAKIHHFISDLRVEK